VISIVIPTHQRSLRLNRLLKSLPTQDWLCKSEIIIIDDDSLSLAGKRNKGASLAKYDLILFIDDDNELDFPSSLFHMAKIFNDKSIAVAGMVACYDDEREKIADAGSYRNYRLGYTTAPYLNKPLYDVWELAKPYEVDEVANAFMVRKDIFQSVGGFDDVNFPIDLDEADLCLRIKKAGYKVVICPYAIVYHASYNKTRIPDFRRPMNAYYMGRNRILFHKKHKLGLGFVIPFVIIYCACLLGRRKADFIKPFIKGVYDGLRSLC
jgi:GT2 family glycosyltransferase